MQPGPGLARAWPDRRKPLSSSAAPWSCGRISRAAHNNLGIVLRELEPAGRGAGAFSPGRVARSGLRRGTNEPRAVAAGPRTGGRGVAALPRGGAPAGRRGGTAPQSGQRAARAGPTGRCPRRVPGSDPLGPQACRAQAHLGLILRDEGKPDEALPWLKRAVELDSTGADLWQYLAEVHADQEDFAEAMPCWEKALRIEPERPGFHTALGWALQEEGGCAEAGRALSRGPAAAAGLGAGPIALGRPARGAGGTGRGGGRLSARPCAAAALCRSPWPGWRRCCAASFPARTLPPWRSGWPIPSWSEEPRARLLLAAGARPGRPGDVRPRRRICLRQANALALEIARRHGRAYVPAEHERFVDGLLRSVRAGVLSPACRRGVPTQRPVFVVGLPRSGTTLIEQVLASHSRVHGAGELRLARQRSRPSPQRRWAAVRVRRWIAAGTSTRRPCGAWPSTISKHVCTASTEAGAERIVDKMPDNYMYLGLLAVMFPRATFIHCRRDLRDVAVSCWMTDFRSIRWANDPQHLASRFQQYRRVMEHWQAVLPATVHEVDYEEAVSDLEGVARRLVAACGLEWEPACLEFHRTQRPIRTASVVQVRQPVYRQSVGAGRTTNRRWRNCSPVCPRDSSVGLFGNGTKLPAVSQLRYPSTFPVDTLTGGGYSSTQRYGWTVPCRLFCGKDAMWSAFGKFCAVLIVAFTALTAHFAGTATEPDLVVPGLPHARPHPVRFGRRSARSGADGAAADPGQPGGFRRQPRWGAGPLPPMLV